MVYHETPDGVVFAVKVTPKARSNQIVGWKDDALCIRIAAIPEKGEANEHLIRYLAELMDIGRSHIRILQGHESRFKRIYISQVTAIQCVQRMGT